MRFDSIINEILTNTSSTDFSKVTTHTYENKVYVKEIQNQFILKRFPSRDSSELMFGVIGNADGLESHLEEYKTLGFNNFGQIFIFESQADTYSKLKRRAKKLNIPFVHYHSPDILSDSKATNSLKLYHDVLHPDLKQNIYPNAIAPLIPHISHLDFDVVGSAPSVEDLTKTIQTYFNYPATKSIVVVCTMSRARGGAVSANTQKINAVYDELMNNICVVRRPQYPAHEDTLNSIINQLAEFVQRYDEQKSITQAYSIKSSIKNYISSVFLDNTPIKVYLEDLSTSLKEISNVSAKIIPYRGLANMISVVAVKDSANVCSVDYSLQKEPARTTKTANDALSIVKYHFANNFGNHIYDKTTGAPVVEYINTKIFNLAQ